jgi:hypothetical protein
MTVQGVGLALAAKPRQVGEIPAEEAEDGPVPTALVAVTVKV